MIPPPSPIVAPPCHSPQPATPRCVGRSTIDEKLQSTPSNHGSVSITEYLPSLSVGCISPAIYADIEQHNNCTVESLLNALLSRCLLEEHIDNPPSDLLHQCLEAVLPLCNTQDCRESKGRWSKGLSVDGLALRDHLTRYCTSTSKEDGYEPFILSFNHALQALKGIDVPLRHPTDLQPLFHRNDPKIMTATHNGWITRHKPDIVLVSLDDAQAAFAGGDQGRWADYAFKTATEPPQKDFQWSSPLSVAEFRRTKSTLPLPPDKYTLELKVIEPQEFISDEDLPAEEVTQHSVWEAPNRSNPVSISEIRRVRPRLDISPESLPAAVQTALYAAERLSHAIWISHTINLVVINDVVYVWWYDHQGAIQSYGINFVQDLPYFLVLLLCFGRFTPEDWGVIPAFQSLGRGADHCLLLLPSSNPLTTIHVKININQRHSHLEIVGRTTQVLPAESQSKDPRDIGKSLEGVELVSKVYWPEASWHREEDIIAKAVEVARNNNEVEGHIPDLICSHDFTKYSTKGIRAALGIENGGHRVLRVMLFRRLYPITELTGENFWKAFWECFRCHYHLWVGGIEHNDISVNNLMYDKLNNRGVLNDYDLAHVAGYPRPSGMERTGTIPFIALDLLTKEALDGHVTRLYRHDCESFAWVLLWICCSYEKGEEIRKPPLAALETSNYDLCFVKKHAILERLPRISPTSSYQDYWIAARELIRWPLNLRFNHDEVNLFHNRDQGPPKIEEMATENVFRKHAEILERAGFLGVL